MKPFRSCLLTVFSVALLSGCGSPASIAERHSPVVIPTFNPLDPPSPSELREDRSVYAQDNLAEVPVIQLTVWDLEGLARVNSNNPPDAEVPVRFQEGTFGAGVEVANGNLSLRGTSTRLAILKSYKIKLEESAGRWRDQKTIHLLKNPWDLTRVRNYLAFEYFKIIRHMTSMRHQFVHVYINGQDAGLYEWFEAVNKRFLASHGLDENGTVYKAGDFIYGPYEDNMFDCVDPAAKCLEPEANSDPAKLKRMLDALNDESRPINDVMDEFFDRDNYETWLATQILFGNFDSASQNYFLYSPSGSEKWYLLPWDYNGAFGFRQQPDWQIHPVDRSLTAPGYWWKVVLHQRFLSDPSNVTSLHERILSLRQNPVLDSQTRRMQATVHDLVRQFASREPDVRSLPVSDWGMTPVQKLVEWEGEWTRIGGLVSQHRHDFERTVEWPMPAWIGSARRIGSQVRFTWGESLDLQGDAVTYDFRVSRTPDFLPADIIASSRGLRTNEVMLSGIPAGPHYVSLHIRDDDDPAEHWVHAFSRYFDIPRNRLYPGVKRIMIP